MDEKRYDTFRNEALEKGLMVDDDARRDTTSQGFFFDLNQGVIWASTDPRVVLELVELARRHADSEEYGEHVALYNLVAKRVDLNSTIVHWDRAYYTPARLEPDRWISLGRWLKENGHPYLPQ
ncbi:MAG: hypothetical protein AAB611_00905 [Patescibacteria group bacterium]